jgi:FMN-dependent NADH-azoreductase
MALILYISASPNGERSGSDRIAREFLDEYRIHNAGDKVRHLPLFEYQLPEFGMLEATAKFAPIYNETLDEKSRDAWTKVEKVISDFKAADKILIASPMWNLGVPYRLKHYIDILVQPHLTFGFDPKTKKHIGLVENKPTQLILTRSSVMPGDFSDFQLPYLRYVLDFIGIYDVRAICAWQTTKRSQEERDKYIVSFFEEARAAARAF